MARTANTKSTPQFAVWRVRAVAYGLLAGFAVLFMNAVTPLIDRYLLRQLLGPTVLATAVPDKAPTTFRTAAMLTAWTLIIAGVLAVQTSPVNPTPLPFLAVYGKALVAGVGEVARRRRGRRLV